MFTKSNGRLDIYIRNAHQLVNIVMIVAGAVFDPIPNRLYGIHVHQLLTISIGIGSGIVGINNLEEYLTRRAFIGLEFSLSLPVGDARSRLEVPWASSSLQFRAVN